MNSKSADLIYLDPPFNSNRNYAAPLGSKAAGAAFKDTWTLSDLDIAWVGLIADEQPATYKVLEPAGLTHGKGMQSYLCMVAIRLLEMRRVLKDTGSIYLPQTAVRIRAILNPQELTRVDGIVDLLFSAKEDIQEGVQPEDADDHESARTEKAFTPVSFHDACIQRISEKLKHTIVRRSKATFTTSDEARGIRRNG